MSPHPEPTSSPPPHALRRVRPWRRFVAAITAFLLLLIVSGVAAVIGFEVADAGRIAGSPLPAASAAATLLPLQTVADQSMSRVVTIESAGRDVEELGTGWLLDVRGDFVTNAHVIEGHVVVRIRERSGVSHVGVIMGVDREQDVAVVRSADGFSGVPLRIAMPGDPMVPSAVVTIASGRATGHDDITIEKLIRIHQDVPVKGNPFVEPGAGTTATTYHDMMVIGGSPIYSGNSGGPLLDGRSIVLGIVTLKSKNLPQGYAIPIARVMAEVHAFTERSAPTG